MNVVNVKLQRKKPQVNVPHELDHNNVARGRNQPCCGIAVTTTAVIGTAGFGSIGETTITCCLYLQFSCRVKVGGLKSARI